MLEMLLGSQNLSDFINQVNNISSISTYDRNMLKKYEETQQTIKEQETKVEEESASINTLLNEKSTKQQEVQNLVATTNDNISSYVSQISASQEEASALMAEVNNADNSISQLMAQAEQEKAAAEAAAAEEAAQEAAQAEASSEAAEEDYDETSDTENTDSESSTEDSTGTADDSDYTEDATETPEETVTEDSSDASQNTGSTDSSESTSSEDTSSETSSSGQGKYLGTFKLTGYCNCAQCCGTAGNATASGTMPVAGRTVAMAGVPFGTQLLINGNVYTVEDLGTPYGHVDIYCSSHSEALSFGLQYAEVYQLN